MLKNDKIERIENMIDQLNNIIGQCHSLQSISKTIEKSYCQLCNTVFDTDKETCKQCSYNRYQKTGLTITFNLDHLHEMINMLKYEMADKVKNQHYKTMPYNPYC